jgi:16S rRNA (guanine966-N2)-methyltransferase
MRIVSGTFKGRSIRAPEGRATRPTGDRARESLFNILEHAPWSAGVVGARVLDLFAGSGALGLEALSRGAVFALFVETDEAARGAIRANIEALGVFGVSRVHRRDATELGVRPAGLAAPFDLVFLDPPYGQGPAEAALARGRRARRGRSVRRPRGIRGARQARLRRRCAALLELALAQLAQPGS